jgi:hypothetical protein
MFSAGLGAINWPDFVEEADAAQQADTRPAGLAAFQREIDRWSATLPANVIQALQHARIRFVGVDADADPFPESFSVRWGSGPRVHFNGAGRRIEIDANPDDWQDLLSGVPQARHQQAPGKWVPPLYVAVGQAVHAALNPGYWDSERYPLRAKPWIYGSHSVLQESWDAGWHIGNALLGGAPSRPEHEPHRHWYDLIRGNAVLV